MRVTTYQFVIALDSDEAREALDIIDDDGPWFGINHLAQWDHGDDDGPIYNEVPGGLHDDVHEEGRYVLVYSFAFTHCALYIRRDAD